MLSWIPLVVWSEGELLEELEELEQLPMVDGEEEELLLGLPVQGELPMLVAVGCVEQRRMMVLGCRKKEGLYL
jgi:hypothetical protein